MRTILRTARYILRFWPPESGSDAPPLILCGLILTHRCCLAVPSTDHICVISCCERTYLVCVEWCASVNTVMSPLGSIEVGDFWTVKFVERSCNMDLLCVLGGGGPVFCTYPESLQCSSILIICSLVSLYRDTVHQKVTVRVQITHDCEVLYVVDTLSQTCSTQDECVVINGTVHLCQEG